MSVTRFSLRAGAMTLIELLCVMAIIMLMAALLLPAVAGVKARAQRLQCVNHLHEVGVGFVNFASDHNGHFPMAVPASDGGTLELAQGAYRIPGEFYFSFRHFQAASNQLVTPQLVQCPTDSRLPAASFAALSNANLSYFIGVNAAFERPTSILAGDRNLTNDYAPPGTLARLGPNHVLRWTEEMHRFKGNLLFADGHVEQKNTPVLLSAAAQTPLTATLALPTVRHPRVAASSPGGGSCPSPSGASAGPGPLGGNASWPTPPAPLLSGPAGPGWHVLTAHSRTPVGDAAGETAQPSPPPAKAKERATNAVAVATPARPQAESAPPSTLAAWLAALVTDLTQIGLCWLYALCLLIAIAALVLRKLARGKSHPATKPSIDSP